MIEPSVLLLDEPLSNLDARLRVEMREEIRTLVKSLGMTTIFVTTPFALRILVGAFAGLDRTLEEASASLGAPPLVTLRRVTLPLLQPGFLAAAVLAFVMSFGHITMSLFLAGEGMTTLPVEIFLIADFSYDVAITAVSVIVLGVALVIVSLVERTTGLDRVI